MPPSYCTRCNRPLPPDSDAGLCPDCLRASTLSGASQPPPGGGPTATPDGLRLEDLPLPRHMLSTRSGAGETSAPATPADPPFEEYLPAAPPGYTLIRKLGQGGMGTVYLARHEASERTVAIKFLHHPGSPTAYERFLGEVRAQVQLDRHPNVVRVYSVETNWREPYFTMEYVAGGTLADLAADGQPLPDPNDAARLILAAAAGVAATHAAKILHRDLKPSNILLQRSDGSGSDARGPRSGTGSSDPGLLTADPLTTESAPAHLCPKVSDFGLAKRTDRDDGLTRTGPLGTPGYMSPEAAAGRFRDITAASDVYGLGATLYYLLTGHAPFGGGDRDGVIHRVLAEAPERPRSVRPGVPAGLEAIVLKAMDKDPAKRYATVEEFAEDLRRFLAGQKPVAPVLTWRRRAWRWAVGRRKVAAALLAGAVLVWAGVWLTRPPDPVEEVRRGLRAGRLVTLVGPTGPPRWSDWALGPVQFGRSKDDGACTFEASNTSLLDLLGGAGIDRYRVTAELQVHDPALGGEARSVLLGLYFWRARVSVAGGEPVHAFLAVTFNDCLTQKVKDRGIQATAQVETLLHVPRPGSGPTEPDRGTAAPPLRFPPAAQYRGDWRRVRVDITPEGVRAYFATGPAEPYRLLAAVTAAELNGFVAAMQRDLDRKHPELKAALPPWDHQTPVGVCGRRGVVAVRAVTAEPLP